MKLIAAPNRPACRVILCTCLLTTHQQGDYDKCGMFFFRFIKGRLKFGDAVNSAPFPSMLVIFRKSDRPMRRETANVP